MTPLSATQVQRLHCLKLQCLHHLQLRSKGGAAIDLAKSRKPRHRSAHSAPSFMNQSASLSGSGWRSTRLCPVPKFKGRKAKK
ncbi:hypothetical protein FF1_035520 [Malus domestica]